MTERGPEGCLIDMADDATNTTWAQLGEQETIWAVADALRAWIEQYGVPLALYVDWKNLYKRPANSRERLRGEEPITQFGGMCAKLGIAVIAASSPEAKGRIERMHGTHQDRLVKKLRRKQIPSHEAANVYLRREYLPEHNRRFARAAARPEDYHRGHRGLRNWIGFSGWRTSGPRRVDSLAAVDCSGAARNGITDGAEIAAQSYPRLECNAKVDVEAVLREATSWANH